MKKSKLIKALVTIFILQICALETYGSQCSALLDAEVVYRTSDEQINFSGVFVTNELVVSIDDANNYTLEDHFQGRVRSSLSFKNWAELPDLNGFNRIIGLTAEGKLYFLVKPDGEFASKAKRLYAKGAIRSFKLSSTGSLTALYANGQNLAFSADLLLSSQNKFNSRTEKLKVFSSELSKALGYGLSLASAILLMDQYPDLVSRLALHSPVWATLSLGYGSGRTLYLLGEHSKQQSTGFYPIRNDSTHRNWFEGQPAFSGNKAYFEDLSDMM